MGIRVWQETLELNGDRWQNCEVASTGYWPSLRCPRHLNMEVTCGKMRGGGKRDSKQWRQHQAPEARRWGWPRTWKNLRIPGIEKGEERKEVGSDGHFLGMTANANSMS